MYLFVRNPSGKQITHMKKESHFKNTNALSMTDTIDLTSISSPIPYKKSIPGQTQTIACPVRLPGYVRGIFFSRDSRPGDFEWPNNTNRLLPWCSTI